MINLIHRKMRKLALRRFRIYDSGDFQSEQNILDWFAIAEALPDVAFWAPTQELAMVRRVLEKHALPDNMIIRASSVYIDGPRKAFDWTSGVTTDKSKVTCPAYTQGGACLDCNQCWDKSVKDVTYPKH